MRAYPPATRSSRSSVSGYLRTSSTSAAAWGVGFGAALFPFLQGSFVDPQLARKNRSRAAQLLARVPDQIRINLGERRWINFVAAQSELAFAMGLHRG